MLYHNKRNITRRAAYEHINIEVEKIIGRAVLSFFSSKKR